MNRGEKIYYDIQEKGKENISHKVELVLRDLVPILGHVDFPYQIDSINKIYTLLENGCYPWMEQTLYRYGYDYGVELQHLLANVARCESATGYDSIRMFINRFPSVDKIHRGSCEYQLDTMLGTITFTPLTRYFEDYKIRNFALQRESHHFCHIAVQSFIMNNPEYRAITSLVANQFGEQHYHSYIETPGGYADFANNVHLSKEDFELIMRPKVLNTVSGHELLSQEKRLTSEDLPANKALLLRLAVHDQVRKRI